MAASNDGGGFIFQSYSDVGLGSLQRGNKPEENSCCERDRKRKEKNAKVWGSGNSQTTGVRGQIRRHEGFVRPISKGKPGEGSEGGKRQAFYQELGNNTAARGAHREPDGHFLFPGGTAHEEQIRQIGTRDKEHEPGSGHEHP